MDEQYRALVDFRKTLMDFNARLGDSLTDLQTQHESVAPYWQDEMRRHYDAIYDPFLETMKHYVRMEGPAYVEFLGMKMYATERYLRGG